jgi:hypothetical protein
MSPTRSEYKELGLELVSLEEKRSLMPKQPLMEGENKYDGTGYPFKLLIEKSLMQERNEMIDSCWSPVLTMFFAHTTYH